MCPTKPSTVARELAKGEAFAKNGRQQEALSCFLAAIALDPKSAPAHLGAAKASRALADWSAAGKYFRSAAELDKNSLEAQLGWGGVLAAEGKIEQAMWRFDRATELADGSAEPQLRAGQALLDYARGMEERPERRRPLGEAERRFEAAAELDSSSAQAWFGVAEARRELKREEEAWVAYGEAIARDNMFREALVGRGQMANNLEKYEDARAVLTPIASQPAGAGPAGLAVAIDAQLGLAAALSGLREYPEAREVVEGLLDLMEERSEEMKAAFPQFQGIALVQQSAILAQLGRFPDAIAPAEASMADGGMALPYGLLMLLAVHSARGDYEKVSRTLVRVEQAYPSVTPGEEAVIVLLRGEVLSAKGEIEEAYSLYREACRVQEQELDLHVALIRLIAREKGREVGVDKAQWGHRLNLAVRRARGVLKGHSDRPSADLAFGALDILSENMEAARDGLVDAVKRNPEAYEGHGLLGMAHAGLGDHDKAAQCFGTALRLAPGNFGYMLALAGTYGRLENYEDAETLYHEILAVAPANVEAMVGLGALLGRREEQSAKTYAEAKSYLTEALNVAKTMNGALADQKGSLKLSTTQKAAVRYKIGIALCHQYEAEAEASLARPRPWLIRSARRAFSKALEEDKSMFRAERALARLEQEQKSLAGERAPMLVMVIVIVLLGLLASSFFFQRPELERLTGQTYAGMTLGLLVVLIAAASFPLLRKLSVAGVSMEKSVDVVSFATKLGVEDGPDLIGRIPFDVDLPPVPKSSGDGGEAERGGPAQVGLDRMGPSTPDPTGPGSKFKPEGK